MIGLDMSTSLHFSLNGPLIIFLTLLAFLTWKLHTSRPSSNVFLVDFSCYKPPQNQICTKHRLVEIFRRYRNLPDDTLDFMHKRLERSGLGQSTYLPCGLLADPPSLCLQEARKESETVIFGAVGELLAKTGVKGKDIGIVVVHCGLFCGLPSLSSVIVSRYKLGDDVLSYNLAAMGCSGGLAAIGLAKNLLLVHLNSYALVVTTENITHNLYFGNDRSKIVANCVFRVGGAATLLSNRPSDHLTAKYRLICTVHTNTARSDRSHKCVIQEEDSTGQVGITMTRDLMPVAIQTIEAHLAALGRQILPLSEKIRYLVTQATTWCLHKASPRGEDRAVCPNFRTAFEHVLPHVGGKSILDGLEKHMRFSEAEMEGSRMSLYRFGNTSSSSVWYALAYAEAKGRVKRCDRVWQLAFGTGFKCSSVMWRAIRTVGYEETNPWQEEIDRFPITTT